MGIVLFLVYVWFSFIFIILSVFSPQKINKRERKTLKVDELGQNVMGTGYVADLALTQFSIPSEAEC